MTPVMPTEQEPQSAKWLATVRFPVPLAEQQDYLLELPDGIKDESGRPLSNAASFPLKVRTSEAPPLAKFAAAPFGIVEWEAAGPSLVPLSLRHVQADLQPSSSGHLRIRRLTDDVEILKWYGRLFHQNEWEDRKSEWLKDAADLQSMTVPPPNPDKVIDVIGVPLSQPGYHVLELKSPRLGQALLDPIQPMFVRTGALVTNLGLHVKVGKDDSLVWVTSLDKGKPVEGAQVSVYDCRGKSLWRGRTDGQGLARIDRPNLDGDSGSGQCIAESGLFITARFSQSGKALDQSFMFSGWSRGIEPWRFNVPIAWGSERVARAHTVTDRPLLRAGDTLSMKHFFRLETVQGLSDATPDQLPDKLRVVFEGTGEDIATLDLRWQGARYALSTWKVPPGAKLGRYRFVMEREDSRGGRRSWDSGSVRVEEFRVPLVDARLIPPKAPSAGAKEQTWAAQLNYMAGGAMAKSPVTVSAMLQPRWSNFPGFDDFAFEPPAAEGPPDADGADEMDEGDGESGGGPHGASRLVLDKLALQTDAKGGLVQGTAEGQRRSPHRTARRTELPGSRRTDAYPRGLPGRVAR
ncbi:MG2 domain-containing protein [Roseateles chitinivorans]|uniref:MG2 domain-containing protein n=1 Tax=Roseateles chitinivorans TaxID=2917965 RepID=UPI003D66A862